MHHWQWYWLNHNSDLKKNNYRPLVNFMSSDKYGLLGYRCTI